MTQYTLTTLKDVFDCVPADRIKACLHELAIAMEQAKAMQALLNAAGAAITDKSTTLEFAWPETSTWIDDGKGTIGLHFLDQDRAPLFDYTIQIGEGACDTTTT